MNILKNFLENYSDLKLVSNSVKTHKPGKNDKTVLVIDDSRTALVSIQKMVRSCNFDCLVAGDALDGIVIAEQLQPDLILMDVEMPGMNGFQATRALRENPITANIPVIIISGTVTPVEQMWGKKIGANGFLPKPMKPSAFMEKAEALLYSSFANVSNL